ncbi:MAG: hypothetical protein PHN54_02915 [Bacilli bacterium]|nr:hypothetical protein [Bacilli bacterium]
MKFIKGFLLTIFSIIFVVFTLGYFSLMGVQRTVLRPQFYKNVISGIDLTKVVYDELEKEIEKNEDEEQKEIINVAFTTIKEVFDKEWMDETTSDLIDDLFLMLNDPDSEKVVEIDFSDKYLEFEIALKANLREYIDENIEENISDTEIDGFVDSFMDQFEILSEKTYSINIADIFESNDISELIEQYNEYGIYVLYGPYVVLFILCLLMLLVGGLKRGMRWISTSMIIPSILFVLVFLVGGLFMIKPLMLNAALETEFISANMVDVMFNNTLFSFLLFPVIFLVIAIIIKIIFRKPKEEPVIIDSGNIVNQAQL